MVECEYVTNADKIQYLSSFNRYMVECESLTLVPLFTVVISFNRYMVECECRPVGNISIPDTVLIDTWWNVNFIRKSANYKNGNGFNRYMVECES